MQIKFSRFHVFTDASWYFLEKFIRLVGAFLIGAWVARHLGPESYGALAYALALIAVFGFFGSLGIESLVVRDLVEGERNERFILSTYFFIRLCGAVFVPFFAVIYLLLTDPTDHVLIVLTLLCSCTVIAGAYDVADCRLQANNNARTTSIIRLGGFFFGAISRSLLIISGASVEFFAAVVLLESGLVAILYYSILRNHGLTPKLQYFSISEFKHLAVAGKMMVLSGFTVAVYSKIDILVIGALLPRESVGSYAIAASMCAAWNMVGMSVVQAWAPRISQSRLSGGDAYILELRNLLTAMLCISVLGSLILCMLAEEAFHFLFGIAYGSGISVFQILIWSSVPIFVGIATSQIIVNERIYWVSLLRTVVGMFASLILILPAINIFGVVGAAITITLSACINVPLILVSVRARKTIAAIFNLRIDSKLA